MNQSEFEKAISDAVEEERQRCTDILELYREDFRSRGAGSLWCRIRNQIANGMPVSECDFFTQLCSDLDLDLDEEDEPSEDENEFPYSNGELN